MAGALTFSSSSLRGFLSAGASLRVLPSARTRAPGGAASCPCCSLGNSCACAVTVTEQVLLTRERLPHKPRPLGKPVLPFRLPLPQKAPAPRLLLPASPAASSSPPVRASMQSTETAASGRRAGEGAGRRRRLLGTHKREAPLSPVTGGAWGGHQGGLGVKLRLREAQGRRTDPFPRLIESHVDEYCPVRSPALGPAGRVSAPGPVAAPSLALPICAAGGGASPSPR